MRDDLVRHIEALVLCHSPSGNEAEIDRWLLRQWQALGLRPCQDAAGNIIATVAPDRPDAPTLAITAHKDEIGMIVKRTETDGRPRLRPAYAALFVLFLLMPVAGKSAPPVAQLPKGSIIAFLPDPESRDYSDDGSLRNWLASQGWAVCDGTRGTPNLNFRLLLGTTRMETAGQNQGTRTHRHRVRGKTTGTQTRQQTFRQGIAPLVRVPSGRHRHELTATTDPAEHLPLSTRVIFIMKIR